jgi:hypothetical protein
MGPSSYSYGEPQSSAPPRRQRLGDLRDVAPLCAGERQRHIPSPPQPGIQVRAAVRSCREAESPNQSP